jgi:hypothetical protein
VHKATGPDANSAQGPLPAEFLPPPVTRSTACNQATGRGLQFVPEGVALVLRTRNV